MFHSHDQWYWQRLEDGSVAIYRGGLLVNTESASSWASIVANVSAGGEGDGRFYAAEALHASTGPISIVSTHADR